MASARSLARRSQLARAADGPQRRQRDWQLVTVALEIKSATLETHPAGQMKDCE